MMEASLLYKLHSHELVDGVKADARKFEEVYRSKYGKVRIYKIVGVDEESKAWTMDPQNRICDRPGSWLCRGQYPPQLTDVLQKKQDFRQKENLNSGRIEVDHDHDFENLNIPEKHTKLSVDQNYLKVNVKMDPSKAEIAAINSIWEDTEDTTELWKLITSGEVRDLENVLEKNPILAHMRSSDGRGPMFWAFEHRRQDMVKLLMKKGVSHSERDRQGLTPVDLLDGV